MSSTNENILKSLATLEQNLQDIYSAKEQVNKVVKTTQNLAEIIKSYQTSFEHLSVNVKSVLDDSKSFNLDSIAKLSEQTLKFSNEITKLADFDISKLLISIEDETVKQFEQRLSTPIEGLEKQIMKIEKEVSKLTEHDFKDSFNNIEKQVVYQFNADLKEKLDSLDKKVFDLKSKISDFQEQIIKLEKIDLESHFNRILAVLSNQTEQQSATLIQKYKEVIILDNNILLHLKQQDKENKFLKTLLFLSIGIAMSSIILNLLFKISNH